IIASIVVKDGGAGMRDGGVRQSELGIERDRLLEHLTRKLQILLCHAPRVTLAAQVKIIRLKILSRLRREFCLLLGRERDAQSFRDLTSNLVLQLKNVLHLAVITF